MTATDFTALEDWEATLQALMAEQQSSVPDRTTSKARAAQIATAISSKDVDELFALQEKMSGIVAQIVATTIDPANLHSLDAEELESLMVELLDQKDVKRLLEVRYAMIRAAIFHHITEANRAKGVEDPELATGEAAVPHQKKKFTREGGRAKATLDHDALRTALGAKRWKKVCRKVTVPATEEHVEWVLDEDLILELVRKDPSVLELFRECVRDGGRTPQSLQIRALG